MNPHVEKLPIFLSIDIDIDDRYREMIQIDNIDIDNIDIDTHIDRKNKDKHCSVD